MASDSALPVASSSDIILTNPTFDEMKQIWSTNFPEWGRGLTLQTYLDRETHMLNAPMCSNGGTTNWILTTTASPIGDAASGAPRRPILSSCETYRKQVLLGGEDGIVKDAWGYGVGSVFTFKELRGRGYGRRMMALLRDHLAKLHNDLRDSPVSVLYSDVGKKFYAAYNWMPGKSTHLEIPVTEGFAGPHTSVKPILDEDVPKLAEKDEELLRQDLANRELEGAFKARLAFVPSAEAHSWHFTRDDFYCRQTFSRVPTARGALYTSSTAPHSRVWVLWTRVYNGGVEKPEKNVLYINRFVVEDENISDAELKKAIVSLCASAREEALEWKLAKILMWNPSDRVTRLIDEVEGLKAQFVVREDGNISSMNWFGEESVDQIEWVASERYVWC